MSCSIGLMLSAQAQLSQPSNSDWRRTPEITIPLMTQTPSIDGEVDRMEWNAAAQLPPLLYADGVADEFKREVFVGYDRENLYIAFRLERPEEVRKPRSPSKQGHIDLWRDGDMVELALNPGRKSKQYFGFALYVNGAYAEGIGKPNMDLSWNTSWRQAARVTAEGWSGEIAVPFASLGVPSPSPGDAWGFDFMDNRLTPSPHLTQWSLRGRDWQDVNAFGRLSFGGAVPAVRFVQAGESGNGQLFVEMEAVNATGEAARLESEIRVLRRKSGAAGGPKSYYDNIVSGGNEGYESGSVEFDNSTSLSNLTEMALRSYEPLGKAAGDKNAVTQELAVPAGQRRSATVLRDAAPGEYLVEYQVRGVGEQYLARGILPIRIQAPLALEVQPYWLHSQMLDVKADLSKVNAPPTAKVRFTLTPAQDGAKPLSEKSAPVIAGSSQVKVQLPTDKLQPGSYRVHAALLGEGGRELAANSTFITKPAPPAWHNSDAGRRVAVPKPWTPVVASADGQVEIWGRTYDLSRFFPAAITSQGKTLMPQPAVLEAVSNGKTLAWQVKSLKLESAKPDKATYRAVLENAVATLDGTVSIEFDGLMWYDLTLTPRGKTLSLDRLQFQLGLASERAKLMDLQKFLHDPAVSRKPLKPVRGGEFGPLVESQMPFTPYLWIGDEQGGLAFTSEGPVHWQTESPDRVLEVQAPSNRRGARLNVNFVDHPVTLEKPLSLSFGLMASPYRPLPPLNVTHAVQAGGPIQDEQFFKALAASGGKVFILHSGWKGNKQSEWSGWPGHPSDLQRRAELKKTTELAHRHGIKVLIYTGWGVDAASDEWKYFSGEMARTPIENSGRGTYRQSAGLRGAYSDYMAWQHANLMREYGFDGVFWDSTSNLFTDENLAIGNGWVDEQGRVRPTYAIRATRDLFRRIYTLGHGEIKDDGVIVNFGGSIWPINVFADVFHRGEGTPMRAPTLREAWQPLEVYRAIYDSRKYGLPYMGMNKNAKDLAMTVNKHLAVQLLHGQHPKATASVIRPKEINYGDDGEPLAAIWQAREWLPLDQTARRYLYFDNQRAVRAQPESLLSSAFVSTDGKRALLVISNLDPQSVMARVRVDVAALGLAGNGTFQLQDAITKEKVEMKDNSLQLEVLGERYRLIKLWRQ